MDRVISLLRHLLPARIALAATVTLVAGLVLFAAACGAPSQAEQDLKSALDGYNGAVDKVRDVDLTTATTAQIESAQARLDAAYERLKQKAQAAGRDTAALLRGANNKMHEALDDAKGMAASARDSAQQALRNAGDTLSSKLDSVWGDLKSLFQ